MKLCEGCSCGDFEECGERCFEFENIERIPAADSVEIVTIESYLQEKLNEWDALGDRKWEPANMWGYNFIRACFDDLEDYKENRAEVMSH